MKKRLVCDTCSALKLAEFPDLFVDGKLSRGQIILHPAIFLELGKWTPEKKLFYKKQILFLEGVRATPGLRVDARTFATQEIIIKATRNGLGLSVGKSDIDQLVSILCFDLDLITNDSPLANLAENLDVNVLSAEEITIEAYEEQILTKGQIEDAFKIWKNNDEKKPSRAAFKRFAELKLIY